MLLPLYGLFSSLLLFLYGLLSLSKLLKYILFELFEIFELLLILKGLLGLSSTIFLNISIRFSSFLFELFSFISPLGVLEKNLLS